MAHARTGTNATKVTISSPVKTMDATYKLSARRWYFSLTGGYGYGYGSMQLQCWGCPLLNRQMLFTLGALGLMLSPKVR